MRFFVRTILPGLLFISTGIMHFTAAPGFRAIVPPQLGDPALIVAVSGVAELAGGIGLCVPATRGAAGLGLIVLLLAVWPANWYMALNAASFATVAPAWVLWLRLPIQLPLIWWVAVARSTPR